MIKGKEPQEELYDLEDDDEDVLPEPAIENLPYIARELNKVYFSLPV